jgi:nucleoside-diphosphate-sugar epimerase
VTNVTIIGAEGFVGSAFIKLLKNTDYCVRAVTRANYRQNAGQESDLVIEAACNSKKYVADRHPLEDFELSVTHRLRTLRDFPSRFHLHISSVDVYTDLASSEKTRETAIADFERSSLYGFHKLLAEQLVRRYAARWLIFRLAGMVGDGLRKNPVFDILNRKALFIHPDSQYQYLSTTEVARIAIRLFEDGIHGEIFNVCGEGLISPRRIAEIAEEAIVSSEESNSAEPRIVSVNVDKIKEIVPVSQTESTIVDYISGYRKLQASQNDGQ